MAAVLPPLFRRCPTPPMLCIQGRLKLLDKLSGAKCGVGVEVLLQVAQERMRGVSTAGSKVIPARQRVPWNAAASAASPYAAAVLSPTQNALRA